MLNSFKNKIYKLSSILCQDLMFLILYCIRDLLCSSISFFMFNHTSYLFWTLFHLYGREYTDDKMKPNYNHVRLFSTRYLEILSSCFLLFTGISCRNCRTWKTERWYWRSIKKGFSLSSIHDLLVNHDIMKSCCAAYLRICTQFLWYSIIIDIEVTPMPETVRYPSCLSIVI